MPAMAATQPLRSIPPHRVWQVLYVVCSLFMAGLGSGRRHGPLLRRAWVG